MTQVKIATITAIINKVVCAVGKRNLAISGFWLVGGFKFKPISRSFNSRNKKTGSAPVFILNK